jgi:hypothetical protein
MSAKPATNGFTIALLWVANKRLRGLHHLV